MDKKLSFIKFYAKIIVLAFFKEKTMKKLLLVFFLALSSHTHSAWNLGANGVYHSNFCRAGLHWQIVPWNFAGTDCYMPMHGLWGKRVLE